jgi:hypothetical protein
MMRISQSRNGRWTVHKPKPIPIYGLDRNAKKIQASSIIISQRIDECLRLNSIMTHFDSNQAEALCSTGGKFLSFSIHLYGGESTYNDESDNSDDDNDQYIFVEIIHTDGDKCSFTFRKECDRIFLAAAGGVFDNGEIQERTTRVKKLQMPKSMLESYTPPNKSDLEKVIERSSDSLHSRKEVEVLFTLQTLLSMTAKGVVGSHQPTSNQLAMLIMSSPIQIRDMILIIYKTHSLITISSNSDKISHESLLLLITCIESIYNKDNTPHPNNDKLSHFFDQLIPALLHAASKYQENPIHASHALSCLNLVASVSTFCHEKVRNTNVEGFIHDARRYGCRENLKLEQSSRALIEMLH